LEASLIFDANRKAFCGHIANIKEAVSDGGSSEFGNAVKFK